MSSNKLLPLVAISFIAVLILFSGCLKKDEEVEKDTGKTDALILEFTPGAPPDMVPEKESFDVSLKMENKGEHTLKTGDIYVILAGVNPTTVNKESEDFRKTNENELIGTRIIDETEVSGGLESMEWTDLKYLVDLSSDQDITFVAQACYNYRTTVTADVCLSANPYAQTTGAETCTVQGKKEVSNSISPVRATKLVENPAGKNKFTFTFTLKNLGDGTVYNPEKDKSECGSLQLRDLGKIRVAKFSIGSQEIEKCKGKEIRLVNGEGKFFCTAEVDEIAGDYKDLLTVKLEYGYRTQTSKTITVKNILGEVAEESSEETTTENETENESEETGNETEETS